MFDIKSLINNKIKNKNHSAAEIDFIVSSYLNNNITDKSMTLWLQAIVDNGMSINETISYTNSIINSGKKNNFNHLNGYVVDKHSTGGIGDKISMVLGPILAACDCYVPMIVGRHLGHTGGTLDKLESIPGYNGLLESKDFQNVVRNVGISIIGQTKEFCPADGKIYSLRGRTNTVASFPLICGSIMSKKIAEGIKGLVLDIKIGNGAFITDACKAKKLGELLALIGSNFNVDVKYMHTNMDQPLGYYAGLLCEISECIDALQGQGAEDLTEVTFKLGEAALKLAGQDNPREKIQKVISNGCALEVFYKMIHAHGGDYKKIKLNNKNKLDIVSSKAGELSFIDTKKIGLAVNYLTITNGKVAHNAGFKFLKKSKDYINKGDVIMSIFGDDIENIETCKEMIKGSYIIKNS